MTVRSGRKCSELLGKPSLLGSLVRMLLESSRWNSTISFLTWKASATPRGRLLFRLVPSMPDTDGTEFGSSQDSLWSTPQARDFRSGDDPNGIRATRKREQGWSQNLNDQVKMWPTPRACEAMETSLPPSRVNNHDKCTLSQSMHHPHFVSGETKANGSLNPAWVEWLMGYPIGHTACAGWETQSYRKSPKKSSAQSPT